MQHKTSATPLLLSALLLATANAACDSASSECSSDDDACSTTTISGGTDAGDAGDPAGPASDGGGGATGGQGSTGGTSPGMDGSDTSGGGDSSGGVPSNEPPCVVEVTATEHDGNGPENALDGDAETRWSAEGDGQSITYDLGQPHALTGLDAMWWQSEERTAFFSVEVSDDARAWAEVTDTQSEAGVGGMQRYPFDPVEARYVRLVGHGNSVNAWNSLLEARVVGVGADDKPSLPTTSGFCGGDDPKDPDPVVPDYFEGNFDSLAPTGFGSITGALFEGDFGVPLLSIFSHEHLEVAAEGGNPYLRQRYVPQSNGSARVGWIVEIPADEEVFLSYRVYFEPGFEFVKGGKMPGLAGGTMPTGGDFSDDGFSARFMWRSDGRIAVYAYHHDRPSQFGEDFYLTNADGSDYMAPVGEWITITERIKMNTDDSQDDGEVDAWVNGEHKLHRDGLRWRINAGYTPDRLLYSSFYGGNDPSWAPSETTHIRYDDFKVASSLAGVQ